MHVIIYDVWVEHCTFVIWGVGTFILGCAQGGGVTRVGAAGVGIAGMIM
jgi:hypothetical protein